MTAAGLDYVSGGRFTLGLAASGPQVIEGFHGVPYDAQVGRTHDVVELCRGVWRRRRLQFHRRRYIPSGKRRGGLGAALAAGKARREPRLGPLGIVAMVSPALGDGAAERLDEVRPRLALHIGGMGAKDQSFCHDLIARYGYAAGPDQIQELHLAGHKKDAAAAVPIEFIRSISLIGSRSLMAERVAAYAAAGVTMLAVQAVAATQPAAAPTPAPELGVSTAAAVVAEWNAGPMTPDGTKEMGGSA